MAPPVFLRSRFVQTGSLPNFQLVRNAKAPAGPLRLWCRKASVFEAGNSSETKEKVMSDNTQANETTGSSAPSHIVYHVREVGRDASHSGLGLGRHGRTKTAKASTSSSKVCCPSTAASPSGWPRKRRNNHRTGRA